ncbi:MAG: aminotransferase [Coriobacteriales bacterium]|jgi:DNA-binding transcriptional MocR family regulator|nr:aminotransferase [Coriobacteriales bacterium]
MSKYAQMSSWEREEELKGLVDQYERVKSRGLKLNMSRGKPSSEQLDLSLPLFDLLRSTSTPAIYHASEIDDYRNYGGLNGIPKARELMAGIMDVPADNVMVLGNSSLNLMYDSIARAMTHGVMGEDAWMIQSARTKEPVKFICPVPGYDRHFAICEHFGIKMIAVQLNADGPDMNAVEALVKDESVKGIWCVPKYANPTGIVYSQAVVKRLAALRPAAADFRNYWDNAYAVHDFVLEDQQPKLYSIKLACEQASNNDIWYQFSSTSKITFPGAGIAAVAASKANLADIASKMAFQTIGPDKLNQLRHVLFFANDTLGQADVMQVSAGQADVVWRSAGQTAVAQVSAGQADVMQVSAQQMLANVRAHMQRHAKIVAPKFAMVQEVLQKELGSLGIGEFTTPKGGYFISFTGIPKTAKRIVQLAKEAGVVLTDAGATYPYADDPTDANIRIAPTYPSIDELRSATELFALCVRIASLEVMNG